MIGQEDRQRHASTRVGWGETRIRVSCFWSRVCILMLLLGLLSPWGLERGMAKEERDKNEKHEYHNIYLTDNRVCRDCTGTWVTREQVQLINRQGEHIVVPVRDILGVDWHPWIRKTIVHSLFGLGIPATVFAPYAFDNGQNPRCKYCPL